MQAPIFQEIPKNEEQKFIASLEEQLKTTTSLTDIFKSIPATISAQGYIDCVLKILEKKEKNRLWVLSIKVLGPYSKLPQMDIKIYLNFITQLSRYKVSQEPSASFSAAPQMYINFTDAVLEKIPFGDTVSIDFEDCVNFKSIIDILFLTQQKLSVILNKIQSLLGKILEKISPEEQLEGYQIILNLILAHLENKPINDVESLELGRLIYRLPRNVDSTSYANITCQLVERCNSVHSGFYNTVANTMPQEITAVEYVRVVNSLLRKPFAGIPSMEGLIKKMPETISSENYVSITVLLLQKLRENSSSLVHSLLNEILKKMSKEITAADYIRITREIAEFQTPEQPIFYYVYTLDLILSKMPTKISGTEFSAVVHILILNVKNADEHFKNDLVSKGTIHALNQMPREGITEDVKNYIQGLLVNLKLEQLKLITNDHMKALFPDFFKSDVDELDPTDKPRDNGSVGGEKSVRRADDNSHRGSEEDVWESNRAEDKSQLGDISQQSSSSSSSSSEKDSSEESALRVGANPQTLLDSTLEVRGSKKEPIDQERAASKEERERCAKPAQTPDTVSLPRRKRASQLSSHKKNILEDKSREAAISRSKVSPWRPHRKWETMSFFKTFFRLSSQLIIAALSLSIGLIIMNALPKVAAIVPEVFIGVAIIAPIMGLLAQIMITYKEYAWWKQIPNTVNNSFLSYQLLFFKPKTALGKVFTMLCFLSCAALIGFSIAFFLGNGDCVQALTPFFNVVQSFLTQGLANLLSAFGLPDIVMTAETANIVGALFLTMLPLLALESVRRICGPSPSIVATQIFQDEEKKDDWASCSQNHNDLDDGWTKAKEKAVVFTDEQRKKARSAPIPPYSLGFRGNSTKPSSF